MAPPVNIDRANAILISSFPYTNTQTVDDAGTTYTVYYRYDATVDEVVSIFGFGDLVVYTPQVEIYQDADVSPYLNFWTLWPSTNVPAYIPLIGGHSYYFEFYPSPAGDPSPAVLTVAANTAPTNSIAIGDFVTNLEVDNDVEMSLAVLDGTTDYTVKEYVNIYPPVYPRTSDGLPHGHYGVMFATGAFGWGDEQYGFVKFYTSTFTQVGTTLAYGADYLMMGFGRVLDRAYVFYASGVTNSIDAVDNTGAVVDTWVTTLPSIKTLAVDSTETIAYYSQGGLSAISRWNLSTNSALADLVADTAGFEIADMIVLEDDTILAVFHQEAGTPRQVYVLQYDAAGSLLNTYDFGTLWRSDLNPPRIGFALDSPTSFWIALKPEAAYQLTYFRDILISDGSTAASVTHVNFLAGVYIGDATATPESTFGAEKSFAVLCAPVAESCTAVAITVQPISQTIDEGNTATLTVTVTGTDPIGYQWYQGESGDQSNPVGTNSNSYTTPELTETTSYWVQASNICSGGSSEFSATAVITVTPTPPTPGPPAATTLQIRWLRQSPTISSDGKRIFHRRFQLDCLVGNGLQTGAAEDVNPAIEVQTSDDGGATWSNVREMFTGRIGAYLTQAKLYQLGAAYNRVYRVYGNSAIAFCIVQAWLDIDGSDH